MQTQTLVTLCPECRNNEVEIETSEAAITAAGYDPETDYTLDEIEHIASQIGLELPLCADCGSENPYRNMSKARKDSSFY